MRYCYKDLTEFISVLEKEGELIRISEPVSADLEISEFYLKEIEKGEAGKALLFESVDDSEIPVLINALGSFKRLKLAFGGMELDELSAELKRFTDLSPPNGWGEKLSKLKQFAGARNFFPKQVKKAPCQERVFLGDDVDLTQLPILKTWPEDAGKFITLPLVFTKSLDGKAKNCGMYRMQMYDKKTTGMHWQIHHDGSNFYSEYRKANKRMEVAVAIGGDPSLPFSAIAPLPPKMYEMLIAGFIRNKPVEMVKCKTVDIEVPAHAEIILEGYVEPDELREEGPFGDHTGYYTLEELDPVFHVTAITTKKNPVYHTTVVGRSPQEDCYFGGKATERIFLPMFQAIAHEVVDMLLPWDGTFHSLMLLSMKKQFPYHGRKLMSQVWGQGQAATCKAIVTTDESVKLEDHEGMVKYVLNHLNVKNDITITEGIVDALDHSSYKWAYGGKIGIDLTTPVDSEPERNLTRKPEPATDEDLLEELKKIHTDVLDAYVYGRDLLNRVLLIKVNKPGNGKIAKTISEGVFKSGFSENIDVLLFFDEKNELNDGHKLMWRLTNNTDWSRDVYFNEDKSKIAIDSTSKIKEDGFDRPWPGDLIQPDEIIKRVQEKSIRIFKN